MENLFSVDDLYLYRSVVMFYSGHYTESIYDLIESKKAKTINKLIDNQQNLEDLNDSDSEDSEINF